MVGGLGGRGREAYPKIGSLVVVHVHAALRIQSNKTIIQKQVINSLSPPVCQHTRPVGVGGVPGQADLGVLQGGC